MAFAKYRVWIPARSSIIRTKLYCWYVRCVNQLLAVIDSINHLYRKLEAVIKSHPSTQQRVQLKNGILNGEYTVFPQRKQVLPLLADIICQLCMLEGSVGKFNISNKNLCLLINKFSPNTLIINKVNQLLMRE